MWSLPLSPEIRKRGDLLIGKEHGLNLDRSVRQLFARHVPYLFWGLSLPPSLKNQNNFIEANVCRCNSVSPDLLRVTPAKTQLTAPELASCQAKGVARGVLGCPWPPFVSLFLSKQPTISRGENAMTIMFDTVWPPPPFETSWLRPCKHYFSSPTPTRWGPWLFPHEYPSLPVAWYILGSDSISFQTTFKYPGYWWHEINQFNFQFSVME